MGHLSTHVLDIQAGRPAADVTIEVFRIDDANQAHFLKSAKTNSDGRTDAPLLSGADLQTGVYELRFGVGDHFRRTGVAFPTPAFIEIVPIRFGVADAQGRYHVPLLVSPWAYSTYRGS